MSRMLVELGLAAGLAAAWLALLSTCAFLSAAVGLGHYGALALLGFALVKISDWLS